MAASGSSDIRFSGWVVTLAAGVIIIALSGLGAVLWQGNASIVRLETQVTTLNNGFLELSSKIAAASAAANTDKYTPSDAARDNATMQGFIRQLQEEQTKMNERITSLIEFRIRLEAEKRR